MSVSDVVILTGPPGAGKSTTARALGTSFSRSVHLHTDDFWHYIISGAVPPYLPGSDEQNQTVMQVIQKAAFTYAAGGFVVVIDGVIGPWMLHHFRDTGQTLDVPRLHYVVLRPSRDETLLRAQARTAPDALVDEGPIVSLWDQFAELDELEDHVIDTTSQTSSETLAAVQAAVEGSGFVLSTSSRT
jgi:chloramphenicol 3-O-phosphotransferase